MLIILFKKLQLIMKILTLCLFSLTDSLSSPKTASPNEQKTQNIALIKVSSKC